MIENYVYESFAAAVIGQILLSALRMNQSRIDNCSLFLFRMLFCRCNNSTARQWWTPVSCYPSGDVGGKKTSLRPTNLSEFKVASYLKLPLPSRTPPLLWKWEGGCFLSWSCTFSSSCVNICIQMCIHTLVIKPLSGRLPECPGTADLILTKIMINRQIWLQRSTFRSMTVINWTKCKFC